jgi:hypothetical protein
MKNGASNGNGKHYDEPEEGSYKGFPTLTIPYSGGRGFTFGLSKGKAIIEHIEAIERWVADTEEGQGR